MDKTAKLDLIRETGVIAIMRAQSSAQLIAAADAIRVPRRDRPVLIATADDEATTRCSNAEARPAQLGHEVGEAEIRADATGGVGAIGRELGKTAPGHLILHDPSPPYRSMVPTRRIFFCRSRMP